MEVARAKADQTLSVPASFARDLTFTDSDSAFVFEMLSHLTNSVDRKQLAELLMLTAREVLSAAAVAIYLFDGDQAREMSRDDPEKLIWFAEEFPIGGPLRLHALQEGRAIHTRSRPRPENAELVHYIGAPFVANQRAIGAIFVFSMDAEVNAIANLDFLRKLALLGSLPLVHTQALESLQGQLRYDHRTGLLNPRPGINEIEQEIRRAKRYKNNPVSLLFFDIDHFKWVNDIHEHAAGDSILKAVADIVRSSLRDTDLAIRYGGDEMMVLLPMTPVVPGTEHGAMKVAERLRLGVARHHFPELTDPRFKGGRLTLSVGVSGFDPDADDHALDGAELIRRADQAMYASKQGGRNMCTLWNARLPARL